MSEIVIAERKSNAFFGTLPVVVIDRFNDEVKENGETTTLFGREVKVDPENLKVNRYMLAYVTNAKEPVRRTKERTNVTNC